MSAGKGRARGRGTVDAATPTMFQLEGGAHADQPAPQTGAEFHPTPVGAILPILETDQLQLPGGIWIEPSAGTGRIIRTVNDVRDDVDWRIFELEAMFEAQLAALVRPGRDKLAPFGDFVRRHWPATWSKADVLIMNPPFSLALDFVLAAFERAHHVLMLQSNNWHGSQDRAPWLRQFAPDMLTLPKRPSFRPDGQTDGVEYSWYYWPPGSRLRRSGRLIMLEPPRGGQQALAL
jgi:hypothetical protein